MLVTELDTKEIFPNRKLLPWLRIMAVTKVSSSTGTSPKVRQVISSTVTTITAT